MLAIVLVLAVVMVAYEVTCEIRRKRRREAGQRGEGER